MTALLQVRDVAIQFGGVHALAGMSLDVAEGTIVGLIGPNGAGKSTLFNVITGLHSPNTGSVVFDGHDITALAPHRRAAYGLARSFQNLGVMHEETVLTNVLAALHRSTPYSNLDVLLRPLRFVRGEAQLRARALEALESFGIAEDAERPVEDLSFAKARFVELAAVTAEEPRLMLLDEPTTGLDMEETARLQEVLAALRAQGTTILVVAHDVGFVMRLCDYVYVLAEGKPLFSGLPDEVQSHPSVVEAYLGTPA